MPKHDESSITMLNIARLNAGEHLPVISLELDNPTTSAKPALQRIGKVLGVGGEGVVTTYADARGQLYAFKIENSGSNPRISAVKTLVAAANNLRLANYVSRPDEALALVQSAQEFQLKYGLPTTYHYLRLRESLPSKSAIGERDLASFNGLISALSGNTRLHPNTFKYARPHEFEGGLIGYINYLVRHAKELNTHLPIGAQVFPEVYAAGIFSDTDSLPLQTAVQIQREVNQKSGGQKSFDSNLRGRGWISMEPIDLTLEDVLDSNLDYVAEGKTPNQRLKRLQDVIAGRIPLGAFTQIIANLSIEHSLGFCEGDLKIGNFAFKTVNGQTHGLLLDPGLVRIGRTPISYTPAYLPEGSINIDGQVRNPLAEASIGKLRVHPALDQYALKLITGAIFEGMEDLKSYDNFLRMYQKEKRKKYEEQITI